MRRAILLILGITLGWYSAFSADLPFTDVKESDTYYEGVQDLYDYGIISDDGSKLFRPDDPITRDMFVGLATSVSCQKCLTPSVEDIIHYQFSPFIDLSKTNTYYYCISYATEQKIVNGYELDTTGNATCQNGEKYASIPFCEENNTTRIEAAAMLLRQAGLWDDTRNTGYVQKVEIEDVEGYWQGYAEKGIQAEILTLSENNTIKPDEAISRGEFAMMAGKMLAFNQCSRGTDGENSMAGAIGARDASGNTLQTSHFREGDGSILIPITSTGTWDYSWRAVNPATGEIVIHVGRTLPTSMLGDGSWVVELDIIDPDTGEIVSEPMSTIVIDGGDGVSSGVQIFADPIMTIPGDEIRFSSDVTGLSGTLSYTWDFGDGTVSRDVGDTTHTYDEPGVYTVTVTVTDETGKSISSEMIINITENPPPSGNESDDNPLSVIITADPLIANKGDPIDFTPYISGAVGEVTYSWDFGDGTTSDTPGPQSHTYDEPGVYTVTLTVTDSEGNVSQSEIIVEVTGRTDSDNDGVYDDEDDCLLVQGPPENGGCPVFDIGDHGDTIGKLIDRDTSDDGKDTDFDGVSDDEDLCILVAGTGAYDGCPTLSVLSGLTENQCFADQLESRGLIIATPVCNVCPCENNISLNSLARKCDILFPAILSEDKSSVYSRGGFYQIQ